MDTSKSNENQYNNNLLIILLVLALLKGNKTKQKSEAILNTLLEEHILTEDASKVAEDLEKAYNRLKEERVKSHIEKARVKMLIKELETGAEQNISLKKVKGEVPEAIEESKLEELDKAKPEELDKEEANKGKADKREPEEIQNENLNEIEEIDLSMLKKEKVEELNKQELEKLNKQELEKPKEVNKEKLKKLEKLDEEGLEEPDKKNLAEIKNVVKTFSGNSIMPMEILLKQLVGENIAFSTVTGSNEFVSKAILLSVKDGIVNINISSRILSIPISEIVGVQSNLIHSIELQWVVDALSEELYEYKEWSLRNLFSTMLGERIFIETRGVGSFKNISNKTVTNVGQGIVVLDNTMAISLSKIILVERR